MEEKVIFECGYGKKYELSSFPRNKAGLIFLLLFASLCSGSFLFSAVILMILAAVIGKWVFSAMENYCVKIQLLPYEIRVRKEGGPLMAQISLNAVRDIYRTGDDIVVQIVTDPVRNTFTEQYFPNVHESVAFLTAAKAQLEMVKQENALRQAVMLQQQAAQPPVMPLPVMPESERNKILAAEHLLQQGMITQQQFTDMYRRQVPAQPLSQAEINARNAADYLQRQEMLAQQLGRTPETDKEQEHGQRSTF